MLSLCLNCSAEFRNKNELNQHINAVHKDIKHCKYCGTIFSLRRNLVTHMKSIHEGRLYNCSECDYKAKKLDHLKVNKQNLHETQIRSQCKSL